MVSATALTSDLLGRSLAWLSSFLVRQAAAKESADPAAPPGSCSRRGKHGCRRRLEALPRRPQSDLVAARLGDERVQAAVHLVLVLLAITARIVHRGGWRKAAETLRCRCRACCDAPAGRNVGTWGPQLRPASSCAGS